MQRRHASIDCIDERFLQEDGADRRNLLLLYHWLQVRQMDVDLLVGPFLFLLRENQEAFYRPGRIVL